MKSVAVTLIAAVGFIFAAVVTPLSAGEVNDAPAEAVVLIEQAEGHLKRTTISYPNWLKRDYPPGVRETTEWGRAFAKLEQARNVLTQPPPPITTTAPPTTTEPPHPPPPTEPPPPTTTEPPPPPPPPSTGYPDASNTGVTNEAALTPWPGHEDPSAAQPVYIREPNQVIENKIFRRTVIVQAPNITFRNVRFQHDRDYWMMIVETQAGGGNANILIEDAHFDGMGARQINAAIGGVGWTLRRVDIEGVEDAGKLSANTDVYDSWCHNLWVKDNPDPHYDCFQTEGGYDVDIVHNTLDVGVGAGRNATIMVGDYFATPTDTLIENNRLLGGGWTIQNAGIGTVVKNNRFGPNAYGYLTSKDGMWPVQCGNVRDDTGEPIDAPC
jgi:hypothetical protein